MLKNDFTNIHTFFYINKKYMYNCCKFSIFAI